MLKRHSIFTEDEVINCDISFDSTRVLVVTKKYEYHYCVTMFNIQSYEKTFEEVIGGDEN